MEGNAMNSHHPWADTDEAQHKYWLDLNGPPEASAYDVIVLTVVHDAFRAAGPDALRNHGRGGALFGEVKSVFARDDRDLRL